MLTATVKRAVKRLATPLFVAATLLVLAQLAATVSAMCVYNRTVGEVDVEFDCGVFCKNDWNTQPGGRYCRQGENGEFLAGLYNDASTGGSNTYAYVDFTVEAHGWVEMTQADKNSNVQVCAYRQDRSQAECQSFPWYLVITSAGSP